MSSEAVAIDSKDYKVADIALADWGRREIAIAESQDALPFLTVRSYGMNLSS